MCSVTVTWLMGSPTVLTVWSSRNEMFVSLVRDGGALPLVADPATVAVIPYIYQMVQQTSLSNMVMIYDYCFCLASLHIF